jgi:DNA polymerase I-like protein with 3'-5' exonuclease and polymerase domains
LNTLIQGAGAVVCKQWLVHMMAEVYASGLDVKLVGSIHDEYQFEVSNQDVKRFTEITKYSMIKTTKTLNLNCPLDSEHKVGTTWLETH